MEESKEIFFPEMSARNSLKHFHFCCLLIARSAPFFLP